MSSYKSEQRRLSHRGREFHFVSYEGRPANERKGETALPAMWFLMSEGKRTAVMPQVIGEDPATVDGHLLGWLDQHVFGGPAVAPPARKR